MSRFAHALRPFWPPLACALAAGALWGWSRQFPETHWAASAPEGAPTSVPAPPEETTAVASPSPGSTPEPTATPEPPAVPSPQAPSPTPTTTPAPTPKPSPTPSDAELAGPLPTHTEAELKTKANQPPAAPRLNVTQIAQDPRLWPKQVVLVAPVRFLVVVNGVVAGSAQVPQGHAVLLKKVNLDGTVLLESAEMPGAQAKTKAQATDLLLRAQTSAKPPSGQ